MTIKELQEDRQAELYDVPYVDAVNYSGHRILGIYHDIDDKVILERLNGKITRNKIYYGKEISYFIADGIKFYLNNFLPENY